ncbi:hypothetical protein PMAYCL1PPCAC_30468, partial [Pristionchus mayeri]
FLLVTASSYEYEDGDFNGAVIEGAPRFKSAVKLDHTIYLGDRVRLRCAAIGQPRPNVFWYRNREPLTEEKMKEFSRIDEDHHHMYINIKRIEAQDQGEWSCLVGNRHGNITRNFKLDIIDLCDQYLAPEIPAAYVLMECVCFWKFTNEILRRDINYTIATEQVCRPYEHRIKYHARKPFSALPCLNPPCPIVAETSVESSEEEATTMARRVPPSTTTISPFPSSPNPPIAEGHVVASVQSGARRRTATSSRSTTTEELPQGDDPAAARRAVERAADVVDASEGSHDEVVMEDFVHEHSRTAEETHASSHREKIPETTTPPMQKPRKHPKSTARSTAPPIVIDPLKMLNMIGQHGMDLVSITLSRLFTGEGRARVQRAMSDWRKLNESSRRDRALTLIRETRAVKDAEYDMEDMDDESYETEENGRRNQPKPKIKLDKVAKIKLGPERDRIVDDPSKRVPPYFVEELEDFKSIVSPAGRTIKMSCRAGGVPSPMYIWYKDENLLYASSTRTTGAEYKMRGHYLEMEDVTESDQGLYRCAVFNSKGEIHRRYNISVVARMRSPPIIVPNILMNQTVNVNDTATFKCKVISDLIPHIMWLKIEQTTDGNYHYYNETAKQLMFNYTETEKMPNAHITTMGEESTLEIRDVQMADQGLYACVTGNSMGKVMANASLTVNEFMAVNILTGVEKQPSNWGSYWLSGLSLFFFLVLLALIIAAILMLVQQKQLKKAPQRRRLMIVARKRDKGDDPKMYVGDLPSSYAVQIIEKDANGHELKKRPRLNSDMTSFEDFEVETDLEWEVDRESEQLGEGAFGVVWKGVYKKKSDNGNSHDIPVAVKRLKDNAHQKELIDLFSEAQMFKIIGRHENVLGLIGCCTGAGPLFVVLELCEHGNLRDFLRAHRPKEEKDVPFFSPNEDAEYLQPKKKVYECVIKDLTQRHLVEWAWQVAKGMKYMSSLKIIHRDLAARNVLVTGNFIMKISDFGLSRDVYSANYYRRKGNGRLPIKWMALEALDSHVYTVESDVWSFGILLWEIMTLGGTPYPTIAMPQLYSCLKDGYRMESPHNCPDEIYNLMVCCWQEKIENRPSFDTIVDYFDWMLTESQRAEQSTDDGGTTHETTIDSETDKGDFSDSSDGTMETDANGTQRRVSRKSKMRPLSAPVLLPSEPAHEICDDYDDNCDWVPGSPAPPIQSYVRPPTSCMRASSTRSPPPLPIPLRTATMKRDGESDDLEALIGHREKGDGPDSAIGSPSGIDSANDYPSSYIDYNGGSSIYSSPSRDYMNVQERTSIFQPRKPEPSRFNFNNVILKYDPNNKAATISSEGSSNLAYDGSPMTARTKNSTSSFSIMSESSGRGGSSAASSAEGLGGISEFCQVPYDRPPLKRQVSSLDEKE